MKNNTELKDTEQCLLELNLICPGTEFNELNYLQPGTEFNELNYLQPGTEFNKLNYLQPGTEFNKLNYLQPGTEFNELNYNRFNHLYVVLMRSLHNRKSSKSTIQDTGLNCHRAWLNCHRV